MKKPLFFILFSLLISCGKSNTDEAPETVYVEDKYDTVAKDSFSNGAISVDVAEQIRKSSAAYQDSVKKATLDEAKKLADEKLKKDAEKTSEKSSEKTSEKTKETDKKPAEEKK